MATIGRPHGWTSEEWQEYLAWLSGLPKSEVRNPNSVRGLMISRKRKVPQEAKPEKRKETKPPDKPEAPSKEGQNILRRIFQHER